MKTCKHDPFVPRNTLVVESHWAAGVRVRCTQCGETSHVSKRGRVQPDDDSKQTTQVQHSADTSSEPTNNR